MKNFLRSRVLRFGEEWDQSLEEADQNLEEATT